MRASVKARLAPAAAALALGLWGLGWGLPSRERLGWVLPPGLDSPAFHARLEAGWRAMHERLGPNLMIASQELTNFSGLQKTRAGWKEPPEVLLNPVRSFYLRSAHDDEQSFLLVLSRMRPRRLDFHPRLFLYGGGYLYPLGGWIGACAAVGVGRLSRSVADYMGRPEDMAGLYYAGRLLSTLAAAATAGLLAWSGAGFAAWTWALSPAVIVQSHVMKQHVWWSLWAVAAGLLAMRLPARARRRDWAAAGALVGLAAGSFYPAAFCSLPVAAAAAARARTGRLRKEVAGLALAAGTSIAVFFILNPYWLLDRAQLAAELSVHANYARAEFSSLLRFVAVPLRAALTLPLLLCAAAGAAAALKRRKPEDWVLLAALAGSLVPVLLTGAAHEERGARYCLSAVAFCGLLAGRFLERRPTVLSLLVLGNLGLNAAVYARNFALAAGERSTWREAGSWLEANLPAGTTLGLWDLPRPAHTPYFRLDRFALRLLDRRRAEEVAEKDLPEYVVVHQPQFLREPKAAALMSRYEPVAFFGRRDLLWARVHPESTTANPVFAVYRRAPSR